MTIFSLLKLKLVYYSWFFLYCERFVLIEWQMIQLTPLHREYKIFKKMICFLTCCMTKLFSTWICFFLKTAESCVFATVSPSYTKGYGQRAGSTHPTGMHSCFVTKFNEFSESPCRKTLLFVPPTLVRICSADIPAFSETSNANHFSYNLWFQQFFLPQTKIYFRPVPSNFQNVLCVFNYSYFRSNLLQLCSLEK